MSSSTHRAAPVTAASDARSGQRDGWETTQRRGAAGAGHAWMDGIDVLTEGAGAMDLR